MGFMQSYTVNGFIAVATSERSVGEVINVGTGKGHTIGDVLSSILKIVGKENVKVTTDVQRVRPVKSEVMELICDNSKAKKLVGWEPQYTLEEGLRITIDWLRGHKNLYDTKGYVV